jgi:hypothetical protein
MTRARSDQELGGIDNALVGREQHNIWHRNNRTPIAFSTSRCSELLRHWSPGLCLNLPSGRIRIWSGNGHATWLLDWSRHLLLYCPMIARCELCDLSCTKIYAGRTAPIMTRSRDEVSAVQCIILMQQDTLMNTRADSGSSCTHETKCLEHPCIEHRKSSVTRTLWLSHPHCMARCAQKLKSTRVITCRNCFKVVCHKSILR